MIEQRFSPIFFMAIFYILGILVTDIYCFSWLFCLLLLLAGLALLVLSICLSLKWYLLPFLLSFLVGVLIVSLANSSLEKSLLLKLAKQNKDVVAQGVVLSQPEKKGKRLFFDFRIEKVKADDQYLKISEATAAVVELKKPLQAERGSKLKIEGQLKLPKPSSSGSFDYQEYLRHRYIQTSFMASSSQIDISPTQNNFLFKAASLVHRRVVQTTCQFLKGDRAGLLLGILIGDTEKISDSLQEDFRLTGLTHILAVSGLNVGMLVVILLFVLRFFRLKPTAQFVIVISVVTFYALVTELEPSVLRASVMAALAMGAWLFGRKNDLIAAISAAAILLLLVDPFLIYNPSFQLSFAATLAILFLQPLISQKLKVLGPRLKELVAVTLAAQLGVLPILVYFFNQLSVISILANVLVVPVTFLLLILGIVALVISFISQVLAGIVYFVAEILLDYMILTAHFLARFPAAAFYLTKPSFWAVLGYYLLLAGAFFMLKKFKKGFKLSTLVIFALACLLVASCMQAREGLAPDKLTVTFFDVGQGDMALIRSPEGKNILIDGSESGNVAVGDLNRSGVGKIDLLILSHPHYDHVGGLANVLESFPVGTVLDAGFPHPSFSYRSFLKKIDEKDISYKLARSPQSLELGKLKIAVFYPDKLMEGTDSDANNNSVVTKITYQDFSVLLVGDVEKEAEDKLLALQENLKADVLKMPHHGSQNGAELAFLKQVSPRVAIISVGAGNPFGHPAKTTLERLESLGTKIYRTDEDGTITVESDGKEFEVETER